MLTCARYPHIQRRSILVDGTSGGSIRFPIDKGCASDTVTFKVQVSGRNGVRVERVFECELTGPYCDKRICSSR